jgi:ATP-dependent DNA helicase DinG
MGLFTSYRLINEAADILRQAGLTEETTGAADRPVLLSQTPRSGTGALLQRFRQHARAVLLGTATFWEGVDFPGQDLEILVVTKLPFLVPSDPWVEARCERVAAGGDNPFTSFMVRDAVLRLRQGFGRLIRRTEDRGVVIILDNRLHTKNYGATFLGALPAMPVAFGDTADLLARVDEFFRT